MKALPVATLTAARRSLAVLSFFSISAFSFFPELAVSQTVYLVTPEGRHAVELLSNTAARRLTERMPLEVTFEDYGSTERIAYLKGKLDISGAPDSCTPVAGDIAYYAPWGNLAVAVGTALILPAGVPAFAAGEKPVVLHAPEASAPALIELCRALQPAGLPANPRVGIKIHGGEARGS